ncbi:helix-turn-helix domain-containing protein [Pelagicoccus mobilis]|uniref:Helix-turn-helix domain-containing protein n=1 Tax=Pelagicoccus mobilis TaxID=415221 RepID=A0A934VTD7_9BACT|nr:helix-turn-helix transcriptional regulator [Pelagicoccus mobilis]MBK1879424.1 helix-turn-helix domain-containing protein [Pelagicoccus mobilis]
MLPNWPKVEIDCQSIVVQEFDGKLFRDSLHEHEDFEFCFVSRGSGDWQIGGLKGRFRAGTLLLCPPRTLHAWNSDAVSQNSEGVSAIVLRFKRDVLGASLFRIPEMSGLERVRNAMAEPLQFSVSDRDRLRARLRSVERAQGVLRLARFLVALELVAGFDFRQVSDREGNRDSLNARDLARVQAVKRFVEGRFRTEISREEAAEMVGLDEASFSRFFRRAMGTTFVDFVASFRVRHAAALLGNRRGISLQEVAEQSGFGSMASFHRQFRKRLGTTPDSYRKAANSEVLAP